MKYGENLKYQREINGYTLLELERQTGISNQNLSRWENNKVEPTIGFCERLADFYGISIDELIGRDYKKESKIEFKIQGEIKK